MMGSYPESDVARASLLQMNEISRRAEVAGMSFNSIDGANSGNADGAAIQRRHTPQVLAAAAAGIMGWETGTSKVMSREEALARIEELQRSRPTSAQGTAGFGVGGDEAFVLPEDAAAVEAGDGLQPWSGAGASGASAHQGLQVYTLGHLMPRSSVDDANGNWSFDSNVLAISEGVAIENSTEVVVDASVPESSAYGAPEQAATDSAPFSDVDIGEETVNPSPPIPGQAVVAPQKLRVRRSTYVPGWAVPPRVLLVDDDAVSRKLSSKFLQVFGCTIDVAVDGVGAVNKMNLEKYDLVLMVRIFPQSHPLVHPSPGFDGFW
jgi:osomolarity two-component system response regulator SKN7